MTDIVQAYEKFLVERMHIGVDWGNIPAYMHEGIAAHVMQGRRTGSFLHAIFSNDLEAAVGHADTTNQHLLKEYVHYMYLRFPLGSYGNPKNVAAWQKMGGQWGRGNQNG